MTTFSNDKAIYLQMADRLCGLGYFVSAGARDTIMQARRREFMEQTLPDVFRRMRLLGIGIDEVVKRWE